MGTNELQRFIDNKSLVALKKFAKAEARLKELKAQHDEVVAQVKQAMIDNGVEKLSGDWGSITLAERTTYSAPDMAEIPKNLSKVVLDTSKVKAQHILTSEVPEGVTESKTQYLTKRFKETT